MATVLLDLILPQRCVACREPGPQLCGGCLDGLPRLNAPICARCGAPTAWPVSRCRECAGRRLAFEHARAAVRYDDAVRRVVAAWKERGLRRLARLAAQVVASTLVAPNAAAIAYIPPDGRRSAKRGHHPAERLALELGLCWELPVLRLIGRAGRVEQQRGLALADRHRNMRGAFRPVGRAPPAVALVDDVYTTGATANAAASALRRGGARRVQVVTFARAVR
jgi:predicted amidophosphoribosyltransferase